MPGALGYFIFFLLQAMITKYEAISSRKMPLALQILTRDKTMVAMSDYGDEHRMLKKLAVGHLLNINTQVGLATCTRKLETVVCLLFVYIHLLLSTCALKEFPMHVCDRNIV